MFLAHNHNGLGWELGLQPLEDIERFQHNLPVDGDDGHPAGGVDLSQELRLLRRLSRVALQVDALGRVAQLELLHPKEHLVAVWTPGVRVAVEHDGRVDAGAGSARRGPAFGRRLDRRPREHDLNL
eukprot:SAG11_NODE_1766_length_4285_cov_2.424032_1_plen_126_part_00